MNSAQDYTKAYNSRTMQSQLGGTRLALFSAGLTLKNSQLKGIRVATLYELQKALYEAASEVAILIRSDAQVDTGAMKAGVYVTNSPSQKVQSSVRQRSRDYQRNHGISPKSYKDYKRAVSEAQALRPSLKLPTSTGKSSYQDGITGRVRDRSRKTMNKDFIGATLTQTFKDMPINEFVYTHANNLYIAVSVAVFYASIVDSLDVVKTGKPHFFSRNIPLLELKSQQAFNNIEQKIGRRANAIA